MRKIFLTNIDEKKEYEVKDVFLHSKSYNRKIGRSEFHSVDAAKLIIHTIDGKVYGFLLKNPIINSKENNDIFIWSNNNFSDSLILNKPSDEVQLYNREMFEKNKIIKNKIKYYESKTLLGLSMEDVHDFIDNKSDLELMVLKNKIIGNSKKGGGM